MVICISIHIVGFRRLSDSVKIIYTFLLTWLLVELDYYYILHLPFWLIDKIHSFYIFMFYLQDLLIILTIVGTVIVTILITTTLVLLDLQVIDIKCLLKICLISFYLKYLNNILKSYSQQILTRVNIILFMSVKIIQRKYPQI